jgi:hypothetical protein
MLTLIQILKRLDNKEAIDSLEQWCMNIAQDETEAFELAEMLDEQLGIELSDIQIDRLISVCQSGTYKSAFKIGV